MKENKYPKLTPSHRSVTNVYCGGCDKLTRTKEFYYAVGECTSTVCFCEDCAPLYQSQSQPDKEFHQNNIENDESIFD